MATALALVATACGGGDSDAGPTATVSPAPATTTTTNPYAIPEVIDAAYVNRVLEGLDAAVGDIVRLVVRTRDIPPEVFDRLKAVYLNRDDMSLFLSGIQRDLRLGFAGYKPNPGNAKTTVDQLLSVSQSCVYVRVKRDYSEVATNSPSEAKIEWIGLQPLDRALDPHQYNPTPWIMNLEGVRSDGGQPPSPCLAS